MIWLSPFRFGLDVVGGAFWLFWELFSLPQSFRNLRDGWCMLRCRNWLQRVATGIDDGQSLL